MERFDPALLDEDDPFEVDEQTTHLFKHPRLGLANVYVPPDRVLSGLKRRG